MWSLLGEEIREIPKWMAVKKERGFIIKECNRKELVLLQASHVPAQIMDVCSPSLQVAALLCAPGEEESGLVP